MTHFGSRVESLVKGVLNLGEVVFVELPDRVAVGGRTLGALSAILLEPRSDHHKIVTGLAEILDIVTQIEEIVVSVLIVDEKCVESWLSVPERLEVSLWECTFVDGTNFAIDGIKSNFDARSILNNQSVRIDEINVFHKSAVFKSIVG